MSAPENRGRAAKSGKTPWLVGKRQGGLNSEVQHPHMR